MQRDLRRKTWFILILVVVVGVYAILPIFNPTLKQWFFRGSDPIRRGLDLKGGIEIILAPDYRVEKRVLSDLETYVQKAVAGLGIAQPAVSLLGKANDNNRYEGLAVQFASAAEAREVLAAGVIKSNLTWRSGIEEKKLKLEIGVDQGDPSVLKVAVQEDPDNFPADALAQAKAIIENRINSSGLAETVVRLDQTKGRIEVQLPGVRSQAEAERLLKSTGRLNFRLDGKIVMYGDDLEEAKADFDPQTGAPVINLRFGRAGAKLFEQITTEHVGEILAIYLDEEMLMAPKIAEPIPNGEPQIRMGSGATIQDAKDYAVLMQAGALPISLRSVMVTQVAPTLGTETVKLSLFAGIIGIILVFLFMILAYGRMGVVADLALVIYTVLVLGAIAVFRGVLTLPGIAGLILGIGMAVDANVIIFERIKDEVRMGRGIHSALEAGFDRAYVTILDANITTLIAAVVLYCFGSGPVKGFAVTLSVSILASMFTALFVSKTFLTIWVNKAPNRFLAKYMVRG
ncbi:MAG: protein translocase subunit SecD [Firmicutes bacterium]|nr:protein translocase subunit SecD [Bacillota bacterium]